MVCKGFSLGLTESWRTFLCYTLLILYSKRRKVSKHKGSASSKCASLLLAACPCSGEMCVVTMFDNGPSHLLGCKEGLLIGCEMNNLKMKH